MPLDRKLIAAPWDRPAWPAARVLFSQEKEAQKVMEQAYGRTDFTQANDAFANAARLVHSRIWVLRPDSSYVPN